MVVGTTLHLQNPLTQIEIPYKDVHVFEINSIWNVFSLFTANLCSKSTLSSIWGVDGLVCLQSSLIVFSHSHVTPPAEAKKTDTCANVFSHNLNHLPFHSLLIYHSRLSFSHINTHLLNWLVGFNQSLNKRMAVSLKLTLLDQAGGTLQRRSECKERLSFWQKCLLFWLQPLCSLFTKWL